MPVQQKPKTKTVKWGGVTIKLRRMTIADRMHAQRLYRQLGLLDTDDADVFLTMRTYIGLVTQTETIKGSLGFSLPKRDASLEDQRAAYASFLTLDADFADVLEPALLVMGAWSEV